MSDHVRTLTSMQLLCSSTVQVDPSEFRPTGGGSTEDPQHEKPGAKRKPQGRRLRRPGRTGAQEPLFAAETIVFCQEIAGNRPVVLRK